MLNTKKKIDQTSILRLLFRVIANYSNLVQHVNVSIMRKVISLLVVALLVGIFIVFAQKKHFNNSILSITVDTRQQNLQFYWKDNTGQAFKSIANLKTWLHTNGQQLIFATNGGMYKTGNLPQGLYIENFAIFAALDTLTGKGNFYLNPNGVFYILADNTTGICKTKQFKNNGNVKYATQSGPMLLVDGQINGLFVNGSKNLNIRNGVGILPNNKTLFAMSKKEINFYDFAKYFKDKGCKNALYLDGFVSKTYLPQQKCTQTDGDFGVIIGLTEKIK